MISVWRLLRASSLPLGALLLAGTAMADLAEEVDVAADGGMVDQRLLVGEAFSAEYPADDVTH